MSATDQVIELTKEQQEVVSLAESGHNLCVFGRAGVGKTTVVKEIRRVLIAKGKTCQIISSSGISCNAYDGVARTVHSYYGLQTAELPDHQIIERALGRRNVVDDVTSTHAIIWDEVSMSSERIFYLINVIQHLVSNNSYPFGGVQMILAGDFWQLKPIPGPFDDGKLIYFSEVFDIAFPHRFELKTLMRQGKDEATLKNALDELRMGDCTDETEVYLQSLSRECTSDDSTCEDTVHLFFKKLAVSLHNLNVLAELPGEFLKYESQDTGHGQCLEDSINKILALKHGCNVMLIYNINDNLKNGSQGKFVGEDRRNKECLIVNFPVVGNVSIARKTWYKYDESGTIKASRTQFPIIPSYAITVHKAQSLTLSRVVVHCSQEFVAGQTYVALSRVTRESSLQVIGFQRRFLLPPPAELASFMTHDYGDPQCNFSCCRNVVLDEESFESAHNQERDRGMSGAVSVDVVRNARKYFEASEESPVNLEDVLLGMLDFNHELNFPPEDFHIKTFLETFSNDPEDDGYSQSLKFAANYGIAHLDLFELLSTILWCRIATLFKDYLSENSDELHVTNKQFTCVTARVHQMFLTQEYRSDIISAFGVRKWIEIDDGQRGVGACLLLHLYQLFLGKLGKLIHDDDREKAPANRFDVHEMGAEGRGKIRYIGGWAIKKTLDKSRRYVVENKFSENAQVRSKISNEMKKIDLMENNAIIPHEILQRSSNNPETLDVIESRQYRGRGLLHISDNAYEFFLSLEQERLDQINNSKLLLLKNDLVDNAIMHVLKNANLERKFTAIFESSDRVDKKLVGPIYNEVCERYMKMGASQSLRDFRRNFHIKKSNAHRKAIMARKEKAREKQMKVQLPEIEQDRSPGKQVSHTRLLALVNQLQHKGMVRLYKKKELQTLCSAYGCRYSAKWNKVKLANELCHVVPRYNIIPYHQITSVYAVEPSLQEFEHDTTRIPVLRIRRL